MKYGSMFYPNKEALLNLSKSDLDSWMKYHVLYSEAKCPSCGVVFWQMDMQENMVPHWKGECKEKLVTIGENKHE
jgi:hypothetical protein